MSGHLSDHGIELYHQRKLAPAELLTAGDHLAQCADCRERMSRAGQLSKLAVALGTAPGVDEPAHLSPEQISAYIDDRMDEVDRSIADSHLDLCAECKAELVDLRELKPLLPPFPIKEPLPIAKPTRWSKLVALWSPRSPWLYVQAGGLAALLLVVFAVLPLRRQVARLNEQLAELEQKNEALRNRISALPEKQDQPEERGPVETETPNAAGAVVVALNDGGGLVTLDRQGRLSGLKAESPVYEQMIKTALTTQQVKPSPLIADLTPKRDVLMGDGASSESFSLRGPMGAVLESDRPAFRWNPLSGATSYIVTVYNSVSKREIVSPRLSGTEWTPSEPLERGGLYAWEVTAIKDGKEFTSPSPPSPQAKFSVLMQAKLDELTLARRRFGDSHLILGILYQQAGLRDEAERQFEALAAANPDSLTARKLLQSVKTHNER